MKYSQPWLFGLVILFIVAASPAWAGPISVEFEDASYLDIFSTLGELSGYNVLVDPEVQGRASFTLRDVEIEEALELITSQTKLAYRIQGRTILVSPQEVLSEHESREVTFFEINYARAEAVTDALSRIISVADIYVSEDGNWFMLPVSPTEEQQVAELLAKVDQPPRLTLRGERHDLITIFKQLSDQLQYNLIADPSLEDEYLVLNFRDKDPWQIIEQIAELKPIEVEVLDNTLIVREKDARSLERIQVYRLNHVKPSEAYLGLSMILSDENIETDSENMAIIFRGTERQLAEGNKYLQEIDQPLPQIMLEVYVNEMSSDALRTIGVDWQGVPSFSGDSASPTFLELTWEPWELVLALKALEEKGEAKLLANPKIATLSGKEASIFVGDRVPITLRDEEGNETLEFLESGINLRVTPRLSDDELITIHVRPEVSTFFYQSDAQYPTIRTREAETIVRVKSGQPVVIGGLIQEEEQELITQIPFISQLPILGRLFQWRDSKKIQTEMNIFLIPRLVEE